MGRFSVKTGAAFVDSRSKIYASLRKREAQLHFFLWRKKAVYSLQNCKFLLWKLQVHRSRERLKIIAPKRDIFERTNAERCTSSPLRRRVNAMWDSVGSRTLLRRRRKEPGWELKNRSHESKLLLAQMNRNQTRIHSCSSGPRVTLIHDSYFLTLIQALSVCVVRGCENRRNPTLCKPPYAKDWLSNVVGNVTCV